MAATGAAGGAASGAAAGTMVMPGWGTLVGGALGAVEGLFGGGGDKGPSQDQLDHIAMQQRRADQSLINPQMARQLAAMLGPAEARRVLAGSMPKDELDRLFGRAGGAVDRNKVQAEIDQINSQLAPYAAENGNKLDDRAAFAAGIDTKAATARLAQLQNMLATGQDPGVTGMLDGDAFDAMGPGVIDQLGELANRSADQGAGIFADYNADTARLSQLGDQNAAQLLGMGRNLDAGINQYGEQAKQRIQREGDRALAGANKAAAGRLTASGLGNSTLVANQMGANARNFNESTQDQIGAVNDRKIGMLTQNGQNTMGQYGQQLGGNLQLASNRSAGRTGLQGQLLDRELSLRASPLNAKMALFSSGNMNPYGPNSGQQYVPQVAQGSGPSPWGSLLSGVGGNIFGRSMDNWLDGKKEL